MPGGCGRRSWRRRRAVDLAYLAATLALTALTWGLIRLCEKL
jgi:hypothetical protein